MFDEYRGIDWCNHRIEELKRERDRLREALRNTVNAWLLEANMGDGIDEIHTSVLQQARAALQEAEDE